MVAFPIHAEILASKKFHTLWFSKKFGYFCISLSNDCFVIMEIKMKVIAALSIIGYQQEGKIAENSFDEYFLCVAG